MPPLFFLYVWILNRWYTLSSKLCFYICAFRFDFFFSSFDVIFIFVLDGSNPIKGDLLVIAGATLYGVSNVSEVGSFSILFLVCCFDPCIPLYLRSDLVKLNLFFSIFWLYFLWSPMCWFNTLCSFFFFFLDATTLLVPYFAIGSLSFVLLLKPVFSLIFLIL